MRAMRAVVAVGLAGVLLVACGDDDNTDSGATSTSTTTAPVDFPDASDVVTHGGTTWAVVLGGAPEPEAPILVAAEAAAGAAGFTTGPTDCDEGAAEALGMTAPDSRASVFTVSVYFDSQEDAEAALDAFHASGWQGGAVGQVQTFCLD